MNDVFSNNPGHQVTVMIRDEDANRYRPLSEKDFDLNRQSDSIASDPRQYSTAPTNYSVASDAGSLFTLGVNEKGFIQNLGTTPIFVKKGDGCSTTSFSFILKGGITADDGNGGFAMINDWMGVVSIATPSNTTLRYIAWKMTPNA